MTLLDTIGEGLKAVNLYLRRAWGDQTRSQVTVEAEIVEAREKKWIALAKLKAAHMEGDDEMAAKYLSAANAWDARLRRLHKDAAAKWP